MKNTAIFSGFVFLAAVLCFLPSTGWAKTWQITCPTTTLQSTINGASKGDIIQVTGTCEENVEVTVGDLTIEPQPSPATAPEISAPSSTAPAVWVPAGSVTINGFAGIGGGSIGILVTGSAIIINNTISGNKEAGIVVEETSSARIGALTDSDTSPSPNNITDPQGIEVRKNSTTGIVGNIITASTPGSGDGILVDRVAQADIGGNTINSFQYGIHVRNGSGANLSQGTSDEPLYTLFNSTGASASDKNSQYAVLCEVGGYVAGYYGNLLGAHGPTHIVTGCANTTTESPAHPSLGAPIPGATWDVTASSVSPTTGTPPAPPTSITFVSNGTGTITGGTETGKPMTWSLPGTQLTIKVKLAANTYDTWKGTITWLGNDAADGFIYAYTMSSYPGYTFTLTLVP